MRFDSKVTILVLIVSTKESNDAIELSTLSMFESNDKLVIFITSTLESIKSIILSTRHILEVTNGSSIVSNTLCIPSRYESKISVFESIVTVPISIVSTLDRIVHSFDIA